MPEDETESTPAFTADSAHDLVPDLAPEVFGDRYLLDFHTDELTSRRTDVLVVGSGIAGLVAALEIARSHPVTLVTKAELSEANTWYAQGGIAGAVGEADSVELHLADTLVVGQGLCDEQVVRAVVGDAPAALTDLQARGVHFDLAPDGAIALAREGGHSLPRVLHSGDATGAEVQDALTSAVRTAEGIEVLEHRFLVDLLTVEGRCVGALVMDLAHKVLEVCWADAIVLATGGCGQAYRVTTNPRIATGDGVAAAWRAGAEIADLEFVQFHPTALDSEASPRFLITEALRGEGAYLLDCDERRFMPGVHPLAELAPRDVVTREIERVMRRCNRPNVWLDARHLGAPLLQSRFPTIWRGCLEAGYDLSRDLLPVAPAAHYQIGGVRVDLDGRTSLQGLYASGEVAASGLHGANRLASNSLLEGLVFSRRIANVLDAEFVAQPELRLTSKNGTVQDSVTERRSHGSPSAGVTIARSPGPQVDVTAARETLQGVMSAEVGASRSSTGLDRASRRIAELARSLSRSADRVPLMEMRNLLTVAGLIASAAACREESRGVHARSDFPERDDAHWRVHAVFRRGEDVRLVPATPAVSERRAEGRV